MRRSDGSIVFGIVAKFFFSVNTITREPLHLARLKVCVNMTSTTANTLLNFKVMGQGRMGFLMCFGVHDTPATRGQYLALSKA